MKFSCTQENLNQILNVVSHITVKNANLPILSNILIKAENNNLSISATNLEIGVSASVRGKIEDDGEFSVDARLFSSYISLLPKDRVDVELASDELKIQCQKQKTKIKGQSSADFPLIPKINKENPFVISADKFKEAIYSVSFAVSTSEIRPEISGVFVDFMKDQLIMTATDSYRLAEIKIPYLENSRLKLGDEYKEDKIIIPAKTLQEVSRILGSLKDDVSSENNENIEIYLEESQIMFVYNGIELVSRLIDGQYPEYNQIIPEKFECQVKISALELIKAVKTSSLFAKNGVFDIKLDFKSNPNELLVISSSSQTGENISNIEMEKTAAGEEITLNYKYLLDGLQNLNSDSVIFEINDSNNPCVIKAEGQKNYLYLIMPIRQ
ncbi:MAG: DNA polymerase III subunit beta [Patescibacteria group bacterium]